MLRVHEVGEHEVDDAIAAAEGHRRLGAVARERMQALALAAGHDHAEDARPPSRHLSAWAGAWAQAGSRSGKTKSSRSRRRRVSAASTREWLALAQRVRHLAKALELRVVLGHPALGVVAGGAGGDQELPVGGLQQHQLARGLGEHALEVGVAAVAASCRCSTHSRSALYTRSHVHSVSRLSHTR